MATKTNEQALEACIEKALTGTCREQLKLEGVGVAERLTTIIPPRITTTLATASADAYVCDRIQSKDITITSYN